MNWKWGLLALGLMIAAIGLTLMITGAELYSTWPVSQDVLKDIAYIGIALLIVGFAITISMVFVKPRN
jgi:hypothetical protein